MVSCYGNTNSALKLCICLWLLQGCAVDTYVSEYSPTGSDYEFCLVRVFPFSILIPFNRAALDLDVNIFECTTVAGPVFIWKCN